VVARVYNVVPNGVRGRRSRAWIWFGAARLIIPVSPCLRGGRQATQTGWRKASPLSA
jgi:hypothetical protein